MAQRRMFSKTITNSSQFLMMPSSTQNLYFHLGMNADDDGFCEHFAIMRMTDSKPDDLRILQAKDFVHVFDDKVLVILQWKENNYLRNDRYSPSKYLDIYHQELLRLSSGIPNGDSGKDRIGKERKEKESKVKQIPTSISADKLSELVAGVPDNELRAALLEWVENRKTMKKPVTPIALKKAIKGLTLWYPNDTKKQTACVERSIISGWQGIFPLNPKDGDRATSGNAPRNMSDYIKAQEGRSAS